MNDKTHLAQAMPACNLCGARKNTPLFDETPLAGHTFSLVRCCVCGLVATVPQPDSAFLERLYSESYKDETVSGAYCLDEHVNNGDFDVVLPRLAQMAPERRLLDVGCGAGAFLLEASKHGWDVHGIEPSPYASGIARKKLGERVKTGVVQDGAYAEQSFDVVTLWYVLEHVPDPTDVLQHCRGLLKPGGALFVAVPNAHYIFLRRRLKQLLSGKPGTVHSHEHLYQYTPATLRKYLERPGFQYVGLCGASPYLVSGFLLNSLKRVAHVGVRTLRLMTGVNLQAMLAFARRVEPDEVARS